jgi:hypothetical protein
VNQTVRRKVLIWLTVAVFGVGATLGAVATWRGVGAVLWGDRIAGSVSAVRCGVAARGSEVCHGVFTAADGSVARLRVRVEGAGEHDATQPANLVRAVNTLGFETVQEEDTAYVGSAAPSATFGIVLAILLTLFALLLMVPAVTLIVLKSLTWLASRR